MRQEVVFNSIKKGQNVLSAESVGNNIMDSEL